MFDMYMYRFMRDFVKILQIFIKELFFWHRIFGKILQTYYQYLIF